MLKLGMQMKYNVLKAVLAIIVMGLVLPTNSYAYLDPGTGAFILQILIAAFIAISLTIKAFWLRIKAFFSRLMSKTPAEEE